MAAVIVYVELYASKIDAFFVMCRLVRFDSRAMPYEGKQQADLDGVNLAQMDSLTKYLTNAPLAHPTETGELPLTEEPVNPFYWTWLVTLKEKVLKVVLGKIGDSLSEGEWMRVQSAMAPYEDYLAQRKGTSVASLAMEKLKAYYHADMHSKVMALIKEDQVVAATLKGIRDLEKFLLYSLYLIPMANNFVSFSQLYSPKGRALFEMGSVVIDGRWFNLALKVDNPAQPKKICRNVLMNSFKQLPRKQGKESCLSVQGFSSGLVYRQPPLDQHLLLLPKPWRVCLAHRPSSAFLGGH
ncbi:MAG: hypothetical protein ACMUJM_19035 [bacterium]